MNGAILYNKPIVICGVSRKKKKTLNVSFPGERHNKDVVAGVYQSH